MFPLLSQRKPIKSQGTSNLPPLVNFAVTFFLLYVLSTACWLSLAQSTEGDFENHYQILGLLPEDYYTTKSYSITKGSSFFIKPQRKRRSERAKIRNEDIKRAYRKQAQLWHPDKVAARKKKNSQVLTKNISEKEKTSDINFNSLSVEQCTLRFTKIAEAYEILNDDLKRYEYDLYLLDVEDQLAKDQRQKERQEKQKPQMPRPWRNVKKNRKSFFENFTTDPLKVFEEFFSTFFEDKVFNRGEQPDRELHTTQVFFDTRLGRDVHRVFHREEFYMRHNQSIYYKIFGQDFLKEYDHIHGTVEFIPVSQRYLVEEGYDEQKTSNFEQRDEQHQNYFTSHHRDMRRKPLDRMSSILEQDQYITSKSKFLHSKNKLYYADLTSECELVVGLVTEDSPFVWTSETFMGGGECYLALYGAQLFVMVGNIQHPRAVLWKSPEPPPLSPGSVDTEEVIEYFASLDNDGCLAVYRRRYRDKTDQNSDSVDDQDRDNRYPISNFSQWGKRLFGMSSKKAPTPPQTQAAAAWQSIQKSAAGFIRRSIRKSGTSRAERIFIPREECVYATGPVGCLIPGRYAIKISNYALKEIKKVVGEVNLNLVEFYEYLSEGQENDADNIDTFIRVSTKVGTSLSKGLMHITKHGAHEVKIVAKALRANFDFFNDFIESLSQGSEHDKYILHILHQVSRKAGTPKGNRTSNAAKRNIENAKVAISKVRDTVKKKLRMLKLTIKDTDTIAK